MLPTATSFTPPASVTSDDFDYFSHSNMRFIDLEQEDFSDDDCDALYFSDED